VVGSIVGNAGVALADLPRFGVAGGRPTASCCPRIESAEDVVVSITTLTRRSSAKGVAPNSIRIIPVADRDAAGDVRARFDRGASSRLIGLTWGAEDLSTAIGASTNRVDSGEYEFTYQLARSLCLLGAHAAALQAIDTITPGLSAIRSV